MGEYIPALSPYSLKTHPKSITLPAIKNKETPENNVNTEFPRATTSTFSSADRRSQRGMSRETYQLICPSYTFLMI